MSTQAKTKAEKSAKFKMKMPDAYVLLFIIALICAALSYFVPAGEFKRVQHGAITQAVPGSYHHVESSPVSIIQFFTAFEQGMINSSSIIFLILFTGGTIAILEESGAIQGLIHHVVAKFSKRQLLFMTIVGIVFSILGTTGIVVNSVIGFIPLGIIVARTLKWDAVVGAAVIYLGSYAGFNATILSPTPLGLSQKIAQLPLFSGIKLRAAIYICFLAATIIYIYIYSRRLHKGKGSVLGKDWFPNQALLNKEEKSEVPFTLRHKLIIMVAGLSILGFLAGALWLQWSDIEMAGTFVFISIISGIIAKMDANKISKTFLDGCQRLVYGALIVGMARAISVILENGKLLDTIVNGLASLLHGLNPFFGAIGMFISSILLHFLISSGSGESVVFIPILAPLADLMHITRQVAV
ncbi:putative ion transporter superfamily protein YfcC [Scopulibacillus daqui]|uniref:Ion transporter superfamily protein YfcC n=1 Tax=Scopulibacillus daqui TaxID=1469162 RepID=A0ABS2Q1K3_9BACL|nr:putative ion transporter superfamily protein YfcC [Scopulibacillus daqui]